MTRIPTKIVAGASLVALGSLAGYTVGSGPAAEQHSAVAQKRRPVEVRTQTIRRTVRIVKHAHPPRTRQAAASAPPPVVPAASPAPPTTQSVPPQPTGSTPVRTRTSGSGAATGEHERAETGGRGEREAGDD
jgi:hypothetical protein